MRRDGPGVCAPGPLRLYCLTAGFVVHVRLTEPATLAFAELTGRVLRTAILGTCAPRARFGMLSFYRSERLEPARVERHADRIAAALAGWD